eukprot:351423-Amorphochlora_amoeboformis.AAC.3
MLRESLPRKEAREAHQANTSGRQDQFSFRRKLAPLPRCMVLAVTIAVALSQVHTTHAHTISKSSPHFHTQRRASPATVQRPLVRSSRPRVRVRPLAASRQSVKEREFKKELGTRQQRLPKSSVEGGKGMKKMKENMVTKGEGNMANGNLPVAALVALLVVFVSNQ